MGERTGRLFKKHVCKLTFKARTIASLIGIPLIAILFTTGTAFASSVHVCLVSGSHYCVGAPSLKYGSAVELTKSGRDINVVSSGGNTEHLLQFDADHSRCVGVSSGGAVVVRSCTNKDAHVYWIPYGTSGNNRWWGNATYKTAIYYLASDNKANHQLKLCTGSCKGWYRNWNH